MKKSSKVVSSKASYTLITIDAKTRKVITPKTGRQIFFAWKDAQGKIYPIESQYSQAYYKTDAVGILAAFKAGSPEAYNVYQQLTKEVSMVLDRDGNRVTETRFDRSTGEERTLFRWKITERNLRRGQRVTVQSVKEGYTLALTRGFPKLDPKEIATGQYVKVPVLFGRVARGTKPFYAGRFTGSSIREMLSHILPDVTTETLSRKGIRTLAVSGYIDVYKPLNPYLEDTPDYYDREKWANKIWKNENVRRFIVGANVLALMDFASRASTGFRMAFSRHGLRVTSLIELEEAESQQRDIDENTPAFRLAAPVWTSIIKRPRAGVRYRMGTAGGLGGKHVSAAKYHPLSYEADGEKGTDRPGSRYETVFDLHLLINGLK